MKPVSKHDSKPIKYNNSSIDTAGPEANMKENHNVILSDLKDCEKDADVLASDTGGLKTTMKEIQNGIFCDLMDCERDADLLASEMNNKDAHWNAREVDSSVIVGDCTKVDKDEITKSVTPCTIPSSEVELLEETYFYTDKNVMECELPELIVCYKESTYHVVKDICIDEGVPSEKKILIESGKDDCRDGSIFLPSHGEQNGDIVKESDVKLEIPDGLDSLSKTDSDKGAANEFRTEENLDTEFHSPSGFISSSENNFGKEANKYGNVDSTDTSGTNCSTDPREKDMDNSVLLVQEFSDQSSLEALPESSDHHGNEVKQLSCQIPCTEVTSGSPAVVSVAEESNISKVETTIVDDLDSSTTAASSRDKSPENVDRQPCESHNVPKHEDGISDNLSLSSQFQYADGESSFSAAVPFSGLITYSGPIAYSGNVSLRSDSSTTSTRSFAFPVLQAEWHSSPVRMAKADRRQLRKHRGWRKGLLCCKF